VEEMEIPQATADTYSDGTLSLIAVKRPRLEGWREVPTDGLPVVRHKGAPVRAFFHEASSLAVLSAVEFIDDGKVDGPEYHLSISRQHRTLGTRRCSSNEARWVLKQFGIEEAIEDNHVPGGRVRNFWRPVADPMVGRECLCVESEPAIVEDKGDFVWRAA
jgi:hypothetical protein